MESFERWPIDNLARTTSSRNRCDRYAGSGQGLSKSAMFTSDVIQSVKRTMYTASFCCKCEPHWSGHDSRLNFLMAAVGTC